MFTKAQRAEFERRLHSELSDLQQHQQEAFDAADTVELDQSSIGRLSRMDAMQSQAMAKATLQRRKQKRIDILAALEKLQGDDFGYCEDCDEVINLPRLEFNPSVAYCLKCSDRH